MRPSLPLAAAFGIHPLGRPGPERGPPGGEEAPGRWSGALLPGWPHGATGLGLCLQEGHQGATVGSYQEPDLVCGLGGAREAQPARSQGEAVALCLDLGENILGRLKSSV